MFTAERGGEQPGHVRALSSLNRQDGQIVADNF